MGGRDAGHRGDGDGHEDHPDSEAECGESGEDVAGILRAAGGGGQQECGGDGEEEPRGGDGAWGEVAQQVLGDHGAGGDGDHSP